jgi:hypothetical protein
MAQHEHRKWITGPPAVVLLRVLGLRSRLDWAIVIAALAAESSALRRQVADAASRSAIPLGRRTELKPP